MKQSHPKANYSLYWGKTLLSSQPSALWIRGFSSLAGTGIIPGPVWIPSTVPVNSFWWVFLQPLVVSSYAYVDQPNTPRDPLHISRILSLVLSASFFSGLSAPIFSIQEVSLGSPFLLLCLETSVVVIVGAVVAIIGLALLVPHLSGSSVLHCLMPNAWRIIVSRNLSVLWLFRVEGSVLFPALNLGHKWKSLELQLSRKLFSFGLFLRVWVA